MPYTSSHAARVEDPANFEKNSFRRKTIAPGISIIVGKKKGSDSMVTQSYRFDKSKFTPEQAKKWLKDHNIKSGFEKAGDMKENEELQEGDGVLAEMEYVPWGVKSFSDLENYRQTKEAAENLSELVYDFQQLASNIVNDSMIEDKKSALASLVEEFVSMLNVDSAMSDEEIAAGESELSEAATVKASAVAAIKALEALLSTKDLPSTLTKQMEEMKGALKKKWADLKDEKDSEVPVEDEEACATDGKKKKMKENEELAESYAGILEVVELSEAGTSLLEMDVQLIRPGWGNSKDGHYYSGEMLKSYAEKFVGAKMYETDHKAAEKNTRTWVSTVKEIKGYTDDGAPIAKVAVHDPNFAERMRNLKAAGLVEKMECSILANGTAKVGKAPDGKQGKIVESITDVSSVDWVTRAGAGGHALSLAESDQGGMVMAVENEVIETTGEATPEPVAEAGEQSTQTTRLSEAQVKDELAKSKLPEASKERLCEGDYQDESELKEAITKEIAYVKKITKSGQPFGLGDTQAPQAERLSEAQVEERKDGVFKKYGLLGG